MDSALRDPSSDARGDGAPLLGPDDPPPFEIVNPRGALPMVLLCDHASNRIPAALGDLGLPPGELERHIAWDIGAAEIARRMARHFDAPAVLAGYSRLVIDCNRRLGDDQSIVRASDGAEVPGNRDLSPRDVADRVEACFRPYHDAAAATIDAVEARGATAAVAMIHSFTPFMDGVPRPWHVGVMWDRDGRMALPLMERLRARGDLCVGDNKPYSASLPVGYTMPAHASRFGRPNVQIEIRQDLIGDEEGIARWTDIMIDAFADIVADHNLYRRETGP